MLSIDACFEIKEKLGKVDFSLYEAATVNKEAAFLLKESDSINHSPKYLSCDEIFDEFEHEKIKQKLIDRDIEEKPHEVFSFHHIAPEPTPYYRECIDKLEGVLYK